MDMTLGKKGEDPDIGTTTPDTGPNDAETQKMFKPSLIRWVILGFILIYMILAYFRAPILTQLGKYLVVSRLPEKSDLIVCLNGANIENGLAAADAYEQGRLKERGVHYPEERDLLVMVLKGLGVPDDVLIVGTQYVDSLFEEAESVSKVVAEKGYRSIILITSPIQSRRTWLTFKRVFKGKEDLRIFLIPSPYSNFKPQDWWKTWRYSREVISEYVTLIRRSAKFL
jgi:uncharacterized SAM-binding protein YcdF (DUF218 family)